MSDAFTAAAEHLNDFQVGVLDDCLNKGSGGLSLPMGSGKTFLSLLVALQQVSKDERILVVCAKSLLASWELEIKRFFGDSLRYEVLHREYTNIDDWTPRKKSKLVITNADTVAKSYTSHEIAEKFVHYEPIDNNPHIVTAHYLPVTKPMIPGRTGVGYLHSISWGCLIVDEVQDYTNINTKICQGLGAIHSKHRWLLSGTIFNEPHPNRILGYHIILDYPDFPRNLPEARRLIFSPQFRGLRRTVVHREKNEAYTPPKINEIIITHSLTKEEAKVYLMMKEVLIELRNHLNHLKMIRAAAEDIKRFSSYLLAMLTYLREGLVCPILPLASVAIDMADFSSKNELSEILTNKLEQLELKDWLDNPRSVRSTRIRKIVKHVDKHPNEQIIIFSCFRCAIDVLRKYLPKKRKNYTLTGDMSGEKRGEVISKFRKSKDGLLLLTYDIGSQGLNLQTASTVMMLDFWWNAGKTKQAAARILRYGQLAETVNVYFFSSNTGVENAILEKQRTKLLAVGELQNGQQRTGIHKMRIQDIIRLIEMESNEDLVRRIYSTD